MLHIVTLANQTANNRRPISLAVLLAAHQSQYQASSVIIDHHHHHHLSSFSFRVQELSPRLVAFPVLRTYYSGPNALCPLKTFITRKGGNCDALQLEGGPTSSQSFSAFITRPNVHQPTNSTLQQPPLDLALDVYFGD